MEVHIILKKNQASNHIESFVMLFVNVCWVSVFRDMLNG